MTTHLICSSLATALTMLVWSPVVSAQSPPVLPSTSQFVDFIGLREIRPTTTTAAVPEQVIGRIAPQIEPPQTLEFEDVFFNRDGYALRPEAVVILDAAVKTLLTNPTININIEGHTCDLGSDEYNIALADRRAEAVRDYFVNRGVSTSRLRTASYGEENPEHANVHEEARRLNRRVALVVRLQP
jgi:outer membrane protein OmpA-like peptidoglycan-associated protein